MKSLARYGIVLVLVLLLSSCLPALPGQTAIELPTSTPAFGLTSASAATATLTFTPSPVPSSTPTISPTSTFTPISTFTPMGGLVITGTPLANTTVSATIVPGELVSLDKLPSSTIYETIVINNNSETEVDISLHCTTIHGLQTVLEYIHVRHLTIQAPQGNYVYVVYVGGKMLSGGFPLLTQFKKSITIYKDRVVIQ